MITVRKQQYFARRHGRRLAGEKGESVECSLQTIMELANTKVNGWSLFVGDGWAACDLILAPRGLGRRRQKQHLWDALLALPRNTRRRCHDERSKGTQQAQSFVRVGAYKNSAVAMLVTLCGQGLAYSSLFTLIWPNFMPPKPLLLSHEKI